MTGNYTRKISSVEDVARYGLCTGCSVCVAACPFKAIEMLEDKNLCLNPHITGDCKSCGICIDMCPGVSCFGSKETFSEDWGLSHAWLGYATDESIRFTGQSGGMISSLAINALRTGFCSGIIVARSQDNNPLRSRSFIARSSDEILSAAKSKYHHVDWSSGFNDVKKGDRLIAVGTPCQLKGLRNAQDTLEKRHNIKIIIYLGLVCDGIMNFGFQDFVLRYAGMDGPVLEFVYKDKTNGYPGDLMIHTAKDKKIIRNHFRTGFKDFFKKDRCRICPDKMNSSADLIFGDAFIDNLHDKEKGHSLIGARKARGKEFIESAAESGGINIRTIDLKILLRCHKPEIRLLYCHHSRIPHKIFNRTFLQPAENEFRIIPVEYRILKGILGFHISLYDMLNSRLFCNVFIRHLLSHPSLYKLLIFFIKLRGKLLSYTNKLLAS